MGNDERSRVLDVGIERGECGLVGFRLGKTTLVSIRTAPQSSLKITRGASSWTGVAWPSVSSPARSSSDHALLPWLTAFENTIGGRPSLPEFNKVQNTSTEKYIAMVGSRPRPTRGIVGGS